MIQITCIKKSGGYHENPHTAISELGWVSADSGQRNLATRLQMYDFVTQGGEAFVLDRLGNKAFLTTAITSSGTKYVKTIPDTTKTDNLLELPECIS